MWAVSSHPLKNLSQILFWRRLSAFQISLIIVGKQPKPVGLNKIVGPPVNDDWKLVYIFPGMLLISMALGLTIRTFVWASGLTTFMGESIAAAIVIAALIMMLRGYLREY